MKAILPYLRPQALKIFCTLLVKATGTIMDLVIPWVLSYLLNHVVETQDLNRIFAWGGIMVLCSVFAILTNIGANRMASAVSRDATRSLRHDLFCKISDLSSRQIDFYTIPSLESRLTNDTYNVNQMLNMLQRLGVRAPLLMVGGLGFTLALEPMLAFVMMCSMPLIVTVVLFMTKKGRPLYTRVQEGIDGMVRTVRENVTGIRVLKALSKTDDEKEHFAQVNTEVVARETKASVTMGLSSPMISFLLNVGMITVILAGAFRVNTGKTQPGTILAFLSYFAIILNAMLMVTRLFVLYSRAGASMDRIMEILHTPVDLQPIPSEPVSEEAHIVFDRVGFSYGGKGEDVSDISFRLNRGETLGIIGATGSGKTTILSLLMRMYDAQSGRIRISGRDVSSYDPAELHTLFGVVFQNDVLFADTIYGNIDFGRKLPREQIEKAAECAQAMEFISQLPEGFDHMVTARGTNLSGGQKQRVLLARALAGHSEILVLDDSSSALDYRTDAALRQALRQHYAGTTTVIVAQRVSSVLHADHILVLDQGRAIGYGKHEDLLRTCSVYREISESQMGGDFG